MQALCLVLQIKSCEGIVHLPMILSDPLTDCLAQWETRVHRYRQGEKIIVACAYAPAERRL